MVSNGEHRKTGVAVTCVIERAAKQILLAIVGDIKCSICIHVRVCEPVYWRMHLSRSMGIQ